MKMRRLGKLEVSSIGMGCMGFSHGYGQVPAEVESVRAIRAAFDFGCTFFDTAEGYGAEQFYPGHNEQLVGKAIAPFRNKIVLATKFRLKSDIHEAKTNLLACIQRHLTQSLENLQTDYIDLYYLHRTNTDLSLEEIAQAMGKLISDGVIRGWGLSQVSSAQIRQAHAVTPISAVQNIYSMVERDCEQNILPLCQQEGIGLVPFSPIASGLLSGKVTAQTTFGFDDVRKFVPQLSRDNLEKNQHLLDLIAEFANRKQVTMAQISLAWMLHRYPHVVPIPGAKQQSHILENLSAWHVDFSDDEFQQLQTALDACAVFGHRGCVESDQTAFGKQWQDETE